MSFTEKPLNAWLGSSTCATLLQCSAPRDGRNHPREPQRKGHLSGDGLRSAGPCRWAAIGCRPHGPASGVQGARGPRPPSGRAAPCDLPSFGETQVPIADPFRRVDAPAQGGRQRGGQSSVVWGQFPLSVDTMRHTRIVVTHYGGPDALRVVEEECPEPKDGEVRVRVLAAGVSLPDIMAREGVHPETPPVPFTPGWDLVGVVDRLGAGVPGVQPGQMVAAMPIHGAYAGFVCLPQHELVPVPPGLDAAEAVCLVLNYITAHQMMHRVAKVRPGQRALIHGAAGGVGTALLQRRES